MTDKQSSKADQVAALRLARVEAKSSDGSGNTEFAVLHPSEQSGHAAMGKRDGVSSCPSETKRGRPRIGETRDKPWEALGMSMRTWYRRQAEKREG